MWKLQDHGSKCAKDREEDEFLEQVRRHVPAFRIETQKLFTIVPHSSFLVVLFIREFRKQGTKI